MRWSLEFLALLFLWTLAPQRAAADIIFVNMNGGATEIPVVQQLARQNGEQLYILPRRPLSQYPDYYETKMATQELMELAREGVRPRTLIVSGHHSEREGFWGDNSEISLYYINNFLPKPDQDGYRESREFFGSIQSVYLWGCYTGALGNIYRVLDGSSPVFPNTKLAVGFGKVGPLNTDPLSGRMLKEVMSRESQFMTAAPEQMLPLLRSVPSYQQRDLIVHRGKAFVNQGGFSTQANFINACSNSARRAGLSQAIATYWKYYSGEAGPIPDDTSKGPLRQSYQAFQREDFCLRMGAIDLKKEFDQIPLAANVVRLVYYKNIIRNFSRIYAPYLQYAQKELQAYGYKDVAFLTQMDQMDRSLVLEKIEAINEQTETLFKSKSDFNSKVNAIYFDAMTDDIEQVVYPSDEYVPPSWIEPNAKDYSKFTVFANFAEARKKAQGKAAGVVTK
jgi:hypothetical protein